MKKWSPQNCIENIFEHFSSKTWKVRAYYVSLMASRLFYNRCDVKQSKRRSFTTLFIYDFRIFLLQR
jgi:hypothetical protein